MNQGDFAAMLKHVWTEPKFRASMDWLYEHGGIASTIEAAVGRQAMEEYIATGQWPGDSGDAEVEFQMPEPPPDFDWWEPRHDAPWRRQDARDRGESA